MAICLNWYVGEEGGGDSIEDGQYHKIGSI
jgi:hypothetical protein